MKTLVLIFMILCSSIASELVSIDETKILFKKFFLNELIEDENRKLHDIFEIVRRQEFIMEKAFDFNSLKRLSLECIICRSAFFGIFEAIKNLKTDDELIDTVTTLCTSLGIQNHEVCSGAVGLNVPIIAHIIRNTAAVTPEMFCGLVYQNAHDPNVCPYDDIRFEWEVDLPERLEKLSFVNSSTFDKQSEPFNVVVLTDVHIDPLYEAFGVADCDAPTCCRKGQSPANSYHYKTHIHDSLYENSIVDVNGDAMLNLTLASTIRRQRNKLRTRYINRQPAEPAGYWGDYRNCDTPVWAFDDVIERIAETHKDVELIYYMGDTIDHGVWETSYEMINDVNRYFIDKIQSSFPDIPVIPVIGNHESQPTNQFAPSYVTAAYLNTTWLYKALADKWAPYLTDEAKETLLDRGDFAISPRKGLKVISLNSNVAYTMNWWLLFDPLDAKRHLNWLVDELYKSEQAGEKVHILTHIPPGVHDLTKTWTREYNRIINRFSSTITGEFNGHVHSDEFKIFYSLTDGSPINVAWGAGAATAYTFYNLNYKIVEFDSETFEIQNMQNYIYNITEANLTPNRRPHWFQLYDMKNSFDLRDLTPASMNDLVYRMTRETFYLDLYSAFFSKLSDGRWSNCDRNCKIDNICKIVVTVLWEREKCQELTNLLNANDNFMKS